MSRRSQTTAARRTNYGIEGVNPAERRLAQLARRQHGVVAHAQLTGLGLSASGIAGYLTAGRCTVFTAVCMQWGIWRSLVTDGSRLLCSPAERGPLSATSVLPFCGESSTIGGCPSTSLGEVDDRSGRGGDHDVVTKRRTLERAIDEADYLRLDWTNAAPRRGRNGSGLLASVLAVHEPGSTRTRSELEKEFLAFCHSHGYECDFVWRAERVIVDTDGRQAHETARARERDPVRDADLQIAGWRVVRITSMRLLRQPGEVAEQLGRLLTPAPAAPA